jgi:hypothetical protein
MTNWISFTGDSSVVVSRDLAKVATRVRVPAFALQWEVRLGR